MAAMISTAVSPKATVTVLRALLYFVFRVCAVDDTAAPSLFPAVPAAPAPAAPTPDATAAAAAAPPTAAPTALSASTPVLSLSASRPLVSPLRSSSLSGLMDDPRFPVVSFAAAAASFPSPRHESLPPFSPLGFAPGACGPRIVHQPTQRRRPQRAH